MARIILAFIIVFGLFHFGIQGWRSLTGKERWTMVKQLTYSLLLATITIVALVLIVLVF
jgi:hypothetical protein